MRAAALTALAAAGILAAGCADRNIPGPVTGAAEPVVTETPATTTETAVPGTIPPSSGTSSPPATASTASGTRCRAGDLSAALIARDSAAGNRYATLVLTNTSRRTCTVFGYGGLQLADASRHPIPTIQRRDPMHPPSLIRLEPGIKASALLHWSAVPHAGESMTGPCEPTPALLLVIPPDERVQIAVRWQFGPVCGRGAIDQWAYAPGIVS